MAGIKAACGWCKRLSVAQLCSSLELFPYLLTYTPARLPLILYFYFYILPKLNLRTFFRPFPTRLINHYFVQGHDIKRSDARPDQADPVKISILLPSVLLSPTTIGYSSSPSPLTNNKQQTTTNNSSDDHPSSSQGSLVRVSTVATPFLSQGFTHPPRNLDPLQPWSPWRRRVLLGLSITRIDKLPLLDFGRIANLDMAGQGGRPGSPPPDSKISAEHGRQYWQSKLLLS